MPRPLLLLALAALLPLGPARAEPVVVKLATMAPSGSAWHQRLRELGEAWSEASGGAVKLRIYPGGVQGSEGDMLRKLAIGQLDAASVTNVGLHDVAPEPQVLSVPQLLGSSVELRQVLLRIRPELDAALERKGLVALNWAAIGQVRLFCTRPFGTPAELAGARVFAWEGDPASAEAWKVAGLRPVVLSSTDLVPALQTGMIDCLANVPVYVLTARLFEKARFVVDVPWGHVVGATVIARRGWERVPAELRPRLLALAREVGARVDADAERSDAEAMVAMRAQGLTVVEGAAEDWRRMGERSWTVLRGGVVPEAFFDQVVRIRDELRRSRVAAGR